MNIYTIIIVIYLGASVAICKIAEAKSKTSKALFVADNELRQRLLIPLLFAGWIGGTTITSAAASGYSTGIMGISHIVGMALGSLIFVIFVSKPYQILVDKKGVMSVPQAFEHFFDEKVKNLMIGVIALTNCMILATVPSSVSALLAPIVGIDQKIMFWIVWLVWVLMTISGGIKGIAAMNIIHSLVMIVALSGVLIGALRNIGGIGVLAETLPGSYFSMGSTGFLNVIAIILGAAIAQPTNTVISSAVFSGKDYKTSVRSILIAALITLPFALVIVFCGMSAQVIVPGLAQNTALSAMAALIGPAFSVMVSMSICAATISTAPASLLAVANIFCNNFYKPYLNKKASDKNIKMVAIIFSIVVSFGLALLGGNAPSLLGQLTGAAQINSVSGIVMIIGLYWKKVDCNGVFWSMLIGTVVGTIWHSLGNPFGIAVLWPSFFSVMIILVVMTLFNKKAVSDNQLRWQELKDSYSQENEHDNKRLPNVQKGYFQKR